MPPTSTIADVTWQVRRTERLCAGGAHCCGVLYPWFGLLLSPIIAGAAMAFSSVTAIGNALRLRSARL